MLIYGTNIQTNFGVDIGVIKRMVYYLVILDSVKGKIGCMLNKQKIKRKKKNLHKLNNKNNKLYKIKKMRIHKIQKLIRKNERQIKNVNRETLMNLQQQLN